VKPELIDIPVSFTIARLLHSVRIVVDAGPSFSKVAREVLLVRSCAVGKADMVTVVELVRTSH
jgi:hypothetical protein